MRISPLCLSFQVAFAASGGTVSAAIPHLVPEITQDVATLGTNALWILMAIAASEYRRHRAESGLRETLKRVETVLSEKSDELRSKTADHDALTRRYRDTARWAGILEGLVQGTSGSIPVGVRDQRPEESTVR